MQAAATFWKLIRFPWKAPGEMGVGSQVLQQSPTAAVVLENTSLTSGPKDLGSVRMGFPKLEGASEGPVGFVENRPRPTPRVSDSAGLGFGPSLGISNQFPGDPAAAGQEPLP